MSKQEEAALILNLYELRREELLRKARAWFVRDFNPQSLDDFQRAVAGEHGGYVRMVVSYWDMAAALVTEGAISMSLFTKANVEQLIVFAKIEKLLPEIRATDAQGFALNLEELIDTMPDGRKKVAAMRDRIAATRARTAAKT